MNTVESIRKLCMSFPNSTEQVQWGYDLVVAKLPAKTRAALSSAKPKPKSAKRSRINRKRKTSRRK